MLPERVCDLTEDARPGDIEGVVDEALDALDELIGVRPRNMLVERRFINPARMEPEQPRLSYRAIGIDAQAPGLGANADHAPRSSEAIATSFPASA